MAPLHSTSLKFTDNINMQGWHSGAVVRTVALQQEGVRFDSGLGRLLYSHRFLSATSASSRFIPPTSVVICMSVLLFVSL